MMQKEKIDKFQKLIETMFKIHINLQEIICNGKFNRKFQQKESHLKILLKIGNKHELIIDNVRYLLQRQQINREQTLYVQQSKEDLPTCVIRVYTQFEQKRQNISKHLGDCEVKFGTSIQQKATSSPLNNSKGNEMFTLFYHATFHRLTQIQLHKRERPSEIQRKISEEEFRQNVKASNQDSIRHLQKRKKRYEDEIERLSELNSDLEEEIKTKKRTIKTERHLIKDKLKIQSEKLESAEKSLKNLKQTISEIFNAVNQSGNLVLVEEVGIALIESQEY